MDNKTRSILEGHSMGIKKKFKKLTSGLDKLAGKNKLSKDLGAELRADEAEDKAIENEAMLREAQATQMAQEAAANMQRNLGVDLTGVNTAQVIAGDTAAGTDAELLRKRKGRGQSLSSSLGVIA